MPLPGPLVLLLYKFTIKNNLLRKLNNQCTLRTASVKTNQVIFLSSPIFSLSSHCHGWADPFSTYRQTFIVLFLVPLVVLVRGAIHIHAIKFSIRVVLGTLPPFRSVSSDLIIGLIDTSRINIVHVINIILAWVFPFHIGNSIDCFLVAVHGWLWGIL